MQNKISDQDGFGFERMYTLLDEELRTYRGVFDMENERAARITRDEFAEKKETVLNSVQTGQNSFDQHYEQSLRELRSYIRVKRTEYARSSSDYASRYLRYRERLITDTTKNMLQKIYDVRLQLDPEDDYLASPSLETGAAASRSLASLHGVLRGKDDESDYAFLLRSYTLLTGGTPFQGEGLEELCLLLADMAGLHTIHSVQSKSQSLAKSDAKNMRSLLGGFEAPATGGGDRSRWIFLKRAFGVPDLLARHQDTVVHDRYDDVQIASYACSHVLNKHRETLPYLAPSPERNLRPFPVDRSRGCDPVLLSMASYASSSGLETLFRRTFMGLMLRYEESSQLYVCDLDELRGFAPKNSHYHDFGGTITLDKNMCLVRIVQDGLTTYERPVSVVDPSNSEGAISPLVFERALSSLMSLGTWRNHAGIQHVRCADDWLYTFARHVEKEHPLRDLVGPLALGVASTNNFGSLVLLNNLDTCISSTISNLPGRSLVSLVRGLGNQDVLDLCDWERCLSRLGPFVTPLKRTLTAWWERITAFVRSYLAEFTHEDIHTPGVLRWLEVLSCTLEGTGLTVERSLSVLYFNSVVHELHANKQLLCDLIDNKLFFLTRNDREDGRPSYHIHQKAIETMFGTTGTSLGIMNRSLATGARSGAAKRAFEQLHRSLQDLEQEMSATDDPRLFLSIVRPSEIECSITW